MSESLGKCLGRNFFVEPEFTKSNYWLNAILLDEEVANERDHVLETLNDAGIGSCPIWDWMCNVAEDIGRRLINLPSSVRLGE